MPSAMKIWDGRWTGSQVRILNEGLRVRVSRGFVVTGYRLRERLAALVPEIRDVQTSSSGAHR
jgi:hypothetical protein